MASNLETAQQLNKLLREQRDLVHSINQNLQKQTTYYREICAAMSKNCNEELDKMNKAVNKTNESLKKARDKAEAGSAGFNMLGKAAKNATKPMKLMGKVVKGVMMAAFLAVMKLVGAYEGLIVQAGKVYDEMLQITRATENVRDKFGTLSHGAGKNVIDMTKRMGTKFRQMGVSMGFGYAASAKLVEVMNEYAGSMSAVGFARFSTLSDDAQDKIITLGMALNLSGQETDALTNRFMALGLNAADEMENIAHGSMKLNKMFGLNAKKTSKDIAKMSSNVKIYGNMSFKAMTQAIGAAAQLGIGIEELTAVSEAFFTFEGAVEATSRLGQAFGMNLDVLKMMSADPADQMTMLRQSMEAAGKSVETMSKREKHYLGQQLKMSGAQAELMFSTRAQTMSQEELNKAMENTDPQKQMVNSMKAVGDNIKSVVVSLNDMGLAGKGFFGAFTTGLSQGLFRFGEFAKIAGKTGGTLKMLRAEGERLGKMLTSPAGVDKDGKKTAAGALHSTFVALGTAIDQVGKHFKTFLEEGGPLDTFMKVLGKGDPDAIRAGVMSLAESIMDTFKNIFSDNKTIGKQFGEAMKGLFLGLTDVFNAYIMPPLREFGQKAVDFLSIYFGPILLAMAGISLGSVVMGFISLTGIIVGLAKIPPAMVWKAIQSGVLIAAFVGGTLITLGLGFLAFDRYISKNLKSPDLTIKAMLALAKITTAMVPALLAASLLGMALVGSAGFGLAALGVGTAAMMGFIVAISSSLLPIVMTLTEISRHIRNPRKFEAATSLFLGIIREMTGMMSTIAAVIKTTKPSIFQTLKGKGNVMAGSMNGVVKIIDAMLGDRTKGMIGMAYSLIAAVREVSFSSQEIRSTLALAELIKAVAEVMEALSGPINTMGRITTGDQVLQAVSFGTRGGKSSPESIMSGMITYMESVSDIMVKKIPAMADKMGEITAKIGSAGIKKIKEGSAAMADVFGALGTAMAFLMNPTSGAGMGTSMLGWIQAFGEDMARGGGDIKGAKRIIDVADIADNAAMMNALLQNKHIHLLMKTLSSKKMPKVTKEGVEKVQGMATSMEAISKATGFITQSGGQIPDAVQILDTMITEEYGPKLRTAFTQFIGAFSDPLFKTVMGSGFENFEWLGNNLEDQLVPSVDKMAEAVARVAIAIPKIAQELSLLDMVQVQAEMRRLGASALFTGQDVTVTTRGENPNVQFNINIKMDAAEVARAVVDTNIVPGTGT